MISVTCWKGDGLVIRLRGSQKVIGTAQHRLKNASEEPAGSPLISIMMLTCFIKEW